MGPFLPEIIGPELNLVIAVFLGMAFGFVLEQAGFSDSRRLAGLFYGYDFVVLRVFFTAGVTAMIGVSVLAYFGLISLDMIYVNPLFTRSAIAGGLIMGLGFILGGFCPGTSVCSAAIGRVDGMVFVLGGLLGVFAYTEFYPLVADFIMADARGPVTVPQIFGISRGLFILMVAMVAIVAFIATSMIEDRVNKRPVRVPWQNRRAMTWVGAAAVIAVAILFMPDRKTQALATIQSENWRVETSDVPVVDIEEVVVKLVERDPALQLVDVRPIAEYETDHIPTAVNVPLDSLAKNAWLRLLRKPGKQTVFYGADEADARKAALLWNRLADDGPAYVMTSGFDGFMAKLEDKSVGTSAWQRFRTKAVDALAVLAEEEKAAPAKPVARVQVQGGC